MFDEVGLRFDDARNQNLSLRQLDRFEYAPFMRVTRIRRLQHDRHRAGAQHDVDHIRERNVAVMRPFVIAPAHVQAQTVGWNVGERVIERLDVQFGFLAKFGEAQVGELDVPAHAEIGTIDLQNDTRVGDRFVFVAHRFRNRSEVSLLAAVMFVAKEQRHDAR